MKPKIEYFLLLLLAMAVMSCAPRGRIESPYSGRIASPSRIVLKVEFFSENIKIADGRVSEDDSVPAPSSGPQGIHWELRRSDGSIAESGAVPDPRWYHWDRIGPDGRLEGGMGKMDFGFVNLNVPAIKGTIRLFETDGAEMGKVNFNPGRWLDVSAIAQPIRASEQKLAKPDKKPITRFQLAFLRFGPGEHELGVVKDRDPVPPPFGVDGDGRVFVLDAEKRRVVRFDPYGAFNAEFPVSGEGALVDLVVEDHGMFSVFLNSGVATHVAYFDEKGRQQVVTPLSAGYGPPFYMTKNHLWAREDKRGGFQPVLEGKWGVVREDERLRFGLPGFPCIFTGPPRALGSATVSILSSRLAEAKLFDGEGRPALRTLLEVPAPLSGVSLLAPLWNDDLVVIFKLKRPGYLVARLDSKLKIKEAAEIERSGDASQFRELAVDGRGRVYQLVPGRGGVEIRRHRFAPQADRVLAVGDWGLEIRYSAKGTRSEGQHGTLLYRGEAVKATNIGEIIKTNLGEMKYYGDSQFPPWGPQGWNFADTAKIQRWDSK